MDLDSLFSLASSSLRLMTPLALAAVAGLLVERSGIVDVGLEGKMLAAAFAGAAAAQLSGSAWVGVGAAVLAATACALLHALVCIAYRGNQLVSGVAINIIVAGATPVLANAWFDQGGATPALAGAARMGPLQLPGAALVRDWPLVGRLYADLLSGQPALTYLGFALMACTAWAVAHTRFGLRLRAVGENPHAADTAGVSVAAVRTLALVASGVLCGLAGATLSIAQAGSFLPEMTAGKGFLALAALIFGRWRTLPVLGACAVFSVADALQIRLEGQLLPWVGTLPSQAIQVLPYALTVLLLWVAGRDEAPRAIGQPFEKSR